jgi:hypothetical protein
MNEKLTHRLLSWIDRTKAWELFFKKLNIYNIRFKGYPAFIMSDYFRIIDSSIPGNHYVFLSTDSKSLSSIAIKRAISSKEYTVHFSHAGILFFDGDRNTSIMHVTAAGLIEQPLIDFLKQVDYFCMIRLPVDKKVDNTIINRIKRLRNRADLIKYDWEERLDNGENLLYCSELVYEIYKDVVDSPNFKPREILGRLVFDPNLLLNCGEIVYCNHPELNSPQEITDLSDQQCEPALNPVWHLQ